jgi:hypothetical protein
MFVLVFEKGKNHGAMNEKAWLNLVKFTYS